MKVFLVQLVNSLNPTVMFSLIMFLLALLAQLNFSQAAKCAIRIGTGFTGILLVVNLMVNQLGPASAAMVVRLGLKQNILDIGWPAMATASWAWKGTAILLPLGLALNVIMLWARVTKTLNVDLWTYWQFAFIGSMVYTATANIWLGLSAALISLVVTLMLADCFAPLTQDFFRLEGVSFPHLTALGSLPLAVPLSWLYDKLPFCTKLRIDPEVLVQRFGTWGEPPVLGFLIGCLLGLLARYPIGSILELGISLGAAIAIIPKMVGILLEGLNPVSQACQSFVARRFKNRKIYIGINTAVTLTHPTVIVLGVLLIPIVIVLAFLLPGNRILPMADITVFPFLFCLSVAYFRGDLVKSLIISTIISGIILYCSTNLSTLETQMVRANGIQTFQNVEAVANIDRGNFLTWVLVRIFTPF